MSSGAPALERHLAPAGHFRVALVGERFGQDAGAAYGAAFVAVIDAQESRKARDSARAHVVALRVLEAWLQRGATDRPPIDDSDGGRRGD